MKVLLAHPGTQHAPMLARELDQRGLLGEYRTCFSLAEGSWFSKLATALPGLPGMRMLRNRIVTGLPSHKLRTDSWNEFYTHWQLRQSKDEVAAIHRRNQSFQKRVPDRSLQQADAIIGFDTSSWILAQRAKALGKPLWLERTIGHPAHWEKIQHELHRRYPEWQEPPRPRLEGLVAAEKTEHDLAHRILVGSSFAARTLAEMGVDPAKLLINSYGVSWEKFENANDQLDAATRKPGPVRFLFAGNINARKGIPVLLEAWKNLGWKKDEAELWLVGTIQERHRRLIPASPTIHLKGRVAKADMAALYRQCDIFVLPSFSEGFALVLLEALATGLPVITTPNTGAEDLQVSGALDCVFLVEAGSVEVLAAAMKHWKNNPPSRSVIRAACDGLRQNFSWEAYGDRWAELLNADARK